jgi:hypothetical protein
MVLDHLSPLAVVALAHDRVNAGQPSAALCQFAFRLSVSASSRPPAAEYSEPEGAQRNAVGTPQQLWTNRLHEAFETNGSTERRAAGAEVCEVIASAGACAPGARRTLTRP